MKPALYFVPFAGAFVALAVACASSSPPPPPDSTVAEFCADWATAYCSVSDRCQFDPNVCVPFQTSVCQTFSANAQASGTRRYSQHGGKACVDALNSAFNKAATSVSAAQLSALDLTCNGAFVGTAAANQSCTSRYDCTGGVICAPVLGGTNSVCVAPTPRQPAAPCGDPGDECQGDSYCALGDAGYRICAPTPITGGACSDAIPCGPENHCVNNVCVARAANGQACATSDDCATAAPYCDPYPPSACTVGLVLGGRGSADCNLILGNVPDAGGSGTSIDAGTGG